MLTARFLVNADYLGRLGGIKGFDLVGGADALAADDQVVLMTQLAADFGDGRAHAARVLFVAEVKKRFADKWSGMQVWTRRPDGCF